MYKKQLCFVRVQKQKKQPCFEVFNTDQQRGVLATEGSQNSMLTVSLADMHRSLSKTNLRKATGPDNILCRVFRVCSSELADVLVDLFNLSPAQASVPTCFKSTTIVPLPKKNTIALLHFHDYRPVALSPRLTKCFERIVMKYITNAIPVNLDPLQFAYRRSRSTDNAINTAIHTTLTHLEGKDTYTLC